MRYPFNPQDAEIKSETFEIHVAAYKVGAIAARVYTLRNEVAQNPFKVNTRLWFSFNAGARDFLTSLPDLVDGVKVPRAGRKFFANVKP